MMMRVVLLACLSVASAKSSPRVQHYADAAAADAPTTNSCPSTHPFECASAGDTPEWHHGPCCAEFLGRTCGIAG